MDASRPSSVSYLRNKTVRRWISRAFIVSIVVYLIVLGYLVAESVTGASRWAPYGVNIPLFISLVIGSEIVMLLTAIQIFREDSGIWPAEISAGWTKLKGGSVADGSIQILTAAWDISLVDLRLRTSTAISMGRLNRIASVVPLVYALAASASGAPWGLRGSALTDIGISLLVWAFMEVVMVEPQERTPATAIPAFYRRETAAAKRSEYSIRRVDPGDLDRLGELEIRNWKDQAASRDVIESRLNNYPEGQLAAIHTTVLDGAPVKSKIVAWGSLMPANTAHVDSFTSWDDLTGNGRLSTSDRSGDVIIGVNLTSVTEGGTYMLSAEALVSVVESGRAKLVIGSRLTGFVSFNRRRVAEAKPPLSADAYARLREIRGFRINEQRLDEGKDPLPDDEYRALVRQRSDNGLPERAEDDGPDYVSSNVRGYMSIPGVRIVRVAPNYFQDPASANYGVIMAWANPIPRPLRNVAPIKAFVIQRIRNGIVEEWELRKQHLRRLAAQRAQERVPAYLRRSVDSNGAPAAPEKATTDRLAASEEVAPRP